MRKTAKSVWGSVRMSWATNSRPSGSSTTNALPDSLTQAKLTLEATKSSYEQTKQNLARLRRDRELMTVRAPADGIVYYGKPSRGKWAQISTVAAMLRDGGVAKVNTELSGHNVYYKV